MPAMLSTVALLSDMPAHRLARGQVGTVVDHISDEMVLVEFCDDDGHTSVVLPCLRDELPPDNPKIDRI